jgi:hypothetical protein
MPRRRTATAAGEWNPGSHLAYRPRGRSILCHFVGDRIRDAKPFPFPAALLDQLVHGCTSASGPALAVDLPTIRPVKQYYARRAAEYDATSWEAVDDAEREAVERFVASLPPGRILDIGCGTGYLTRLLRGRVVAVDQSAEMLKLAQARARH